MSTCVFPRQMLNLMVEVRAASGSDDGQGGITGNTYGSTLATLPARRVPVMANELVIANRPVLKEQSEFWIDDPDGVVTGDRRLQTEDGRQWGILAFAVHGTLRQVRAEEVK